MSSKGGSNASSDASSDSSSRKISKNKPKYSRFYQQELPAYKPIITPAWVITTFITLGVAFIPIGLACLFASGNVVEIRVQYDDECIPNNYKDKKVAFITSEDTKKTCNLKLQVPKQMKAPVYIYYELHKFYQNHRRYVKSRSDKQMRSPANVDVIDECKPEDKRDGAPIVPCGLIAWSMFNDTFSFSINKKKLDISKNDIAWPSDQKSKFGSNVYPKNFQKGPLVGGAKLEESLPLSEQVDLIIWMRTAALPSFKKLYGKIEEDIDANQEIDVVVENNYNTYSFQGEKTLVLSTTSWIGGRNNFLGRTSLIVGLGSLFLAISFILTYVVKPRPLGDPSYLSWNKNPKRFSN